MTIKNIITVLTIFLSGFCYAGTSTKVDFNFDWKFSKPAGFVPQDTLFLSPDIKWEDVCLPHDWSISEGYFFLPRLRQPEAMVFCLAVWGFT